MTSRIWKAMFRRLERPVRSKASTPTVPPLVESNWLAAPEAPLPEAFSETNSTAVMLDGDDIPGDATPIALEAGAAESEEPDEAGETAEPDVAVSRSILQDTEDRAWRIELQDRRAEARALALAGAHKISLSESAGPGSLAEALNELVRDGKVVATFVEDDEHGAHLAYRPR